MNNKKNKRDIKYETVRVVAMLFVITIHQLDPLRLKLQNPITYNIFSLILLTCNGMFFMLSGKFALQFNYEKEGCYKKYYFNKFVGLIIPVLVYMAIKIVYLMKYVIFIPITFKSVLKTYIKSVIEGYAPTEYWFIYYLIANLIVAPFLARIFKNINKKESCLFFVICLISNALMVYPKLIGINFAVPFYLAGMNVYFFMGSLYDKMITNKKEKVIVIILGIISYGIAVFQLQTGKAINIYDLAPTAILTVAMMYTCITSFIKIRGNTISKIILFLGKHSFSIYLIHMTMLDVATYIFPYNENIPIAFYIVVKVVMILLLSLVATIIIDNTIVKILQKIIIKINESIESKINDFKKKNRKLIGETIRND